MQPEHLDASVIYYPTLKKLGFGGGTLKTEYDEGKAYTKGTDVKVTKTPSKVVTYVKAGRNELILVGHGKEATDEKFQGKVVGGGKFSTPQEDAGELATRVFNNLGDDADKIVAVWLWICHSSQNGVGTAVKEALRARKKCHVYATPLKIGGIFYWLRSLERDKPEDVGQDSFVEMK